MNADTKPDRLREVLRLGDPAAQEPGLTADEFHAMRRAVLTATPVYMVIITTLVTMMPKPLRPPRKSRCRRETMSVARGSST